MTSDKGGGKLTDTYDSKKLAENLVLYMKTKFFRFLVSQYMYSHHITKESYSLVPILDMETMWTDEMLYKRYGLTSEEILFIESKIRPMDNDSEPEPQDNGEDDDAE